MHKKHINNFDNKKFIIKILINIEMTFSSNQYYIVICSVVVGTICSSGLVWLYNLFFIILATDNTFTCHSITLVIC